MFTGLPVIPLCCLVTIDSYGFNHGYITIDSYGFNHGYIIPIWIQSWDTTTIIPKMFGSIIYINQQGSGCSSCSPPVQPFSLPRNIDQCVFESSINGAKFGVPAGEPPSWAGAIVGWTVGKIDELHD